jgi:tetratricopeptide (TPR) repeat protein
MMRPVFAVVSCAVVLAGSSVLACGNSMMLESESAALLVKAKRSFGKGEYRAALDTSIDGLAFGAAGADRRALLRINGLSRLKLGDHDGAARVLKELLGEKREPFIEAKQAEAVLRARGFAAEGARSTLQALADKGLLSDADAWTALGHARAKAGDVEAAKAAWASALKVQPGHEEAAKALAALDAPKPSSAPVKPSAKS